MKGKGKGNHLSLDKIIKGKKGKGSHLSLDNPDARERRLKKWLKFMDKVKV